MPCGAHSRGSDPQSGRHVVSWSKIIYLPKSIGNTQVEVAPSRQNCKIAEWNGRKASTHSNKHNYDPGLTLTYFTARSNFASITWENVTMMEFFGIIVSCDLEIYSKLNE